MAMLARPVVTREETPRIKDFGLGRGVDCTDEFPWINKKPIQVCPVEFETVIGTEEGGAMDSFDHEVDGVEDWKPTKCSLPASLYLNLDVEYSRCRTQNRHTIGRKVATRTVSLLPPGTLVVGHNDDSIVEFFKKYQITHYVSEIQLGAEMYRTTTASQYTSLVSGKGTFGIEKMKPFNVDLNSSKSWKTTKNVSSLKQIGSISSGGTVERGSYDEAVIKVRFESITSLVQDATAKGRLQHLIKSYAKTRQGQFKITCNEGKLFLGVDADGKVRGTPRKKDATYFNLISVDGGKDSYEFVLGYYKKYGDEKNSDEEDSDGEDSGGEDCGRENCDEGHGATNRNWRAKNKAADPNNTLLLDHEAPALPKKHTHQGPAEQDDVAPTSRSINNEDMVFQSTKHKLAHYLHVTRCCFRSGPLQMVDRTDEESSRLTAFSRLFNRDRRVSPSEWIRGEDMFYICTRAGRLRKRGYLCVRAELPYNTACTTNYNSAALYTLFQAVPRKVKFSEKTAHHK